MGRNSTVVNMVWTPDQVRGLGVLYVIPQPPDLVRGLYTVTKRPRTKSGDWGLL